MELARRKNRRGFLERVVTSYRFILLVVLTIVMALGYIRLRFEQTRMGYEISVNEKIKEEILNEKLFLVAEQMRLKSPERIENEARKLGFKFPTQEDVIYIDRITIVGEKGE